MKRYTIYKILDLVTNEYYIGVHYTSNPNDNYMGSGIHITRKIKKYGKERFRKDILFIFDNKDEAFQKEKDLIKENRDNPLCINIAAGGEGGSNFKGKHHSKESMIKMIETRTKNGYRFHTEETKRKISESQIGRKAWNKGLKYNNDMLFTDEHKKKISDSVKEYYKNNKQKNGWYHSEESRKKMSQNNYLHKYGMSEEEKEKRRIKMKEIWKKRKELQQKSETDI